MLALPLSATAEITKVALVERSDVLDGTSMHEAGPYERIIATPHFVIDPDSSVAALTVRDSETGPYQTIRRDQWKFSADLQQIIVPGGFEPGRIYELVYEASDPAIAGLGLAAVRDIVSFLKYGSRETLLPIPYAFYLFSERTLLAQFVYRFNKMRKKFEFFSDEAASIIALPSPAWLVTPFGRTSGQSISSRSPMYPRPIRRRDARKGC